MALCWSVENIMYGHTLVVIKHLVSDPGHSILSLIHLLCVVVVLTSTKVTIICLLVFTFVKTKNHIG